MTSPGGSLTERLQLIVEATTQQAEARFTRLTGVTREAGETATRSANSVRDAADRVAAARDRELTASGNLRVAETRLESLRTGGRARADQLAAAEERVAAAQRNLHLATRNTQRATEEQTETQRRAGDAAEDAGKKTGFMQDHMDKLVASAVALGGKGLVDLLRSIGDQFAGGARDAAQLATSMNATVGEAGAFLGLVGSLGLEMNDLLEIQAEFATKVGENGQALQELGVQTDRNADGTVNWANTLVNFLDQLSGVEDATERNRLGFQFLGEEGYKQMSTLVSSGVDVRDALEQIGVPFTEDDVRATREYDAAMLRLSLTSTQTQQALGRAFLPVITGVAEGIGDVIDVVEAIPAPLGIATAAAIALGVTGFSPTAVAGARLAAVKAALTRQLAVYTAAATTATGATSRLAVAQGLAGAAGGRLVGMLGGPLGVALITLGAAYGFMSEGSDDFRESAREAGAELAEAEQRYGDMAMTSTEMGRRLAAEAGVWEGLAASRRGASQALAEDEGILGWGADATGGVLTSLVTLADQMTGGELAAAGFTDEIENQREELGAFGEQAETAQRATKSLNEMIAEGTTSGGKFAEAVQRAAEAQENEARTSDLAEAAIAAYNATTRDAVQTTLDLFSAHLNQRGSLIDVQQAFYDLNSVVDDSKTPWNEVTAATDEAIGTVLEYASSSADAAVAAATATNTILTPLAEAKTRADATINALKGSLNDPNITASAREQITGLITQLETASKSGDIKAILSLTGAPEVAGELDETTEDRDTKVKVESRGGPAVKAYLDKLAADRLLRIRLETRNGPAVNSYLDRLTGGRLSLIRVESRNGPAVDDYLDGLASQRRVAYIDVEERAGAPRPGGPTGLGMRGAPGFGGYATGGGSGQVTVQNLNVTVQADATGRVTPQSAASGGRAVVRELTEYTRRNGSGWLRNLNR